MKLIKYIGFVCFLTLIGCNGSDLKEKKIYHKNGNLKEKFLIDQNKHRQGVGHEYYEDGHLKEIREYYDGKSNGEYRSYYLNGKLETKGKFKSNIQIDTTLGYLNNGHLDAIAIYDKNGNILKEISFFSNGKVHIMRSYFVNGGGQINALKTYFENGKINEEESDFAKLKYTGKNDNFLNVKLYNCDYTDTVYVRIIKNFNYKLSFDADVIRTLKFTKTTNFNFKLLDSDFVKNKANIQIIGKKWFSLKSSKQCAYNIQISKGTKLPKDNVEGIYKIY
jgi:antitoxin component YwqK of YwqJK toxin-antitoxin module